ncbi:MAG: PaaI family thioesterase [Candidatus Aphodosoma sp.]
MLQSLTNPWTDVEGYDCFGCNPHNPIGLKMKFWVDTETDDIVCVFPLNTHNQGWTDTLHGGIQATLTDEISSWQINYKSGVPGVTSNLNIRYRKPVSTLLPYVIVRVETVRQRRRIIDLHATIHTPDGTLCSEADLTFVCFPTDKVKEMNFRPCVKTGPEMTMEEVVAEMTR